MALTAGRACASTTPAASRPRAARPSSWPTTSASTSAARGEVAIVVTELATNLVRHGGGGEIVLRVSRGERPTVDAIASTAAPACATRARALEDGYSTGGGPGNGLGAIERLSATMDLQTRRRTGTVVAARLGADGDVPAVDGLALADGGRDGERRRLGPACATARC